MWNFHVMLKENRTRSLDFTKMAYVGLFSFLAKRKLAN